MSAPRTYARLNAWRKAFQVGAIAFLAAVPVLNWLGIHWIVGSLYSISIGELDIADPVMALQATLLSREVYVPLLIAAAIPALLALVFGRVFCSWMCPYNTLLEWVDRAERRWLKKRWLRTHRRGGLRNPPAWRYWAIFAGLLALTLVAGLPLIAWLSAPGILTSQLAQAVLGLGIGLELALVAALLVAEIALARRLWCTYACPVGAMLALFRSPATMRVQVDSERCLCKDGSEACAVVCPIGLLPSAAGIRPYCINCGSCLEACEKTGRSALRFTFAPSRSG